ncbi:Beta-glucuronidase [Flagellimonas maritima]|uniref:Beta-glucuronidase n=2 Tax=Flagellimonas maritima TaxID=1383885 RepID=A0A2Z4LPF2_9FLAO|nr:Beta-glucuronidase [Allomuricauda aurantiaca]
MKFKIKTNSSNRFVLLTLCLMALYSGFAQSSLIQNIDNRTTVSLDGTWQIIIDPLENGYYNHRYQPKDNGFFMNEKMQTPSDLIEYNFDEGYELQVPGDWNTQMEKLYYYEGTVWYKRSFDYDKKDGKRVFVHFGAVNYDAKVYLNGKKLGDHIGGYTSFNFEVTDLLKAKDNFLVLKVDNTRKREAIPTVNTDWWNYGGITRSVTLVETELNFIRDYFIQLKKGSKANVEGWIQLDRPLETNVSIEIPELNISKNYRTDANGRALVSFNGAFDLWSPQNPKLYKLELVFAGNSLEDQIGFRTVETRGHKILLNGSPLFLKGISVHEEAPFSAGRVTTMEECEVLVSWAKEMGCNFIRLAHYPHSEQMVKAAEAAGLLVWSEIPVYWTVPFDNPETYANAENQLTDMISRDKNRTNIILWSVANETPISDARIAFLSNLSKKVKSLDNTRLTTAALDTQSSADGYNMIDDPLGEHIDVIGINQYCGWYFDKLSNCAKGKWKTSYDKPVIISEFGGGALQGYHGSEDERWTEEYQDALYKYNLQMLDNIEFMAGMTPWILKDFLSPRRNLKRIQNDFNRKGLISEEGIRKKAFYRMQDYYKGKN